MSNESDCETEGGGLLIRHSFKNTEHFSSHAERGESDLNGDWRIPCWRLGKLTVRDAVYLDYIATVIRRYS